jgi:hypothetical protein
MAAIPLGIKRMYVYQIFLVCQIFVRNILLSQTVIKNVAYDVHGLSA